MELEPCFERIKKVVNHEEPDRVPLCEVLIDYPIQSQFLGKEVTADDLGSQIDFWVEAGYDYIPITVGMMKPGGVTQESAIMETIRDTLLKDSPELENEKNWSIEYKGYIKNREDFEKFPWNIASRLDLSKLRQAKYLLPEGMKVIATSGKIFTLTWMLMGFNDFCTSLILDEQLVADMFKRVGEIQLNALDEIFKMQHIGGVWAVDDLAFSSGPMLSPDVFRTHLFPWYKEVAKRCHENNLLFFFHTDGNVTPSIEDFIDIGVDVLHPIDPTCMNIYEVKKIYGDKICLAGNVPNDLLEVGTTKDIESYTKKLIQNLAPGAGYLIGSGNSVPEWSHFENFMAMRNTALNYGKYPIK
jgi:uroporphyrinogen decarboxylase